MLSITLTLKVRIFNDIREITLYIHINVINYTVTLKVRLFNGIREITQYIFKCYQLHCHTEVKNI